ncbi:MAG: prepilin peptidase [Candidatus Roizmanbacteria bacterium]|nr:MAG: prepilin peptidase [Candidatus Roizmanbacteria bacterium]
MVLTFLFFSGIAIGSFLNVLIDRLPQERSINGRSVCDNCHHQLAWYDLLPLVSFILLKGKCRYCNNKIPSVLPFVEILTGVIFVSIWLSIEKTPVEKIIYLGIMACLIVIFFADAKYKIIPDSIQVALLIFSFLLFYVGNADLRSLPNQILSGFFVMLPILLIYLATKGRGMGFGDVKFSFIIGLLLGTISGFLALYIAFVIGAVIGVILILAKKKKLKNTIAFGPFLVLGLGIMLVWGEKVIEWARKIYGL